MVVLDTRTGEAVSFEPGKSVEMDFVEDCVTQIISRGVGVFRTEAHVKQDIRDGIKAAIHTLKSKVR